MGRHRSGEYLRLLSAALTERDLTVQIDDGKDLLTARNPAPQPSRPLGPTQTISLSQIVTLRRIGRLLWWCWVWEAQRPAERGAPMPPPEIEPMCPAGEIGRAARLIVNVVAVRGDPGDV